MRVLQLVEDRPSRGPRNKESRVTTPNDPNRQSRLVWTILVILGAVLAVAGWYKWAS
jgi:hypothetical protein